MPTMPTRDTHSLNSGALQTMVSLLRPLSTRERESLARRYVQRQDDERICRELRIPLAEVQSVRMRIRSQFYELYPRATLNIAG
jgi:DNA-directed RNA polymerase specialized sigma24 family protein